MRAAETAASVPLATQMKLESPFAPRENRKLLFLDVGILPRRAERFHHLNGGQL